MWELNLSDLFRKGGVVMWPLLACSVLGFALIVERTLVILWSVVRFRSLVDCLRPHIQRGRLVEARRLLVRFSRSPVARVALTHLEHLKSPAPLREEIVAREASQELAALEKRLNWLALLAQVTPLLGLFGTVLGLMNAFYQIDAKGSGVQTADLAVGIWQKLLNTAFGLAIAVPCLMMYFWLEGRVGLAALQMEWITSYLNEWLGEAQPTAPIATINGSKPAEGIPVVAAGVEQT